MNIEQKAKAYDEAVERAFHKAKAYDEALERAKEWITEREQLICPREIVESIFPQLRESEDERIRKAIESIIRVYGKTQGEWIAGYDMDTLVVHLREAFGALEKQKERNDEDEECTDFTIYHPLKNGEGKYECIPYSFYGSLTSFSEDKDLIDFLRTCFYTKEECNEWIEQQKEQKPEEKPVNWTELTWEDINELEDIINKVHYEFRNGIGQESFGKEVLEQFREYKGDEYLDEEQKPTEWSEEDEEMIKSILFVLESYVSKAECEQSPSLTATYPTYYKEIDWLKSIRPSWKPSEEEMAGLLVAIGDEKEKGSDVAKTLRSLYEQLKKL